VYRCYRDRCCEAKKRISPAITILTFLYPYIRFSIVMKEGYPENEKA